MNLRLLSLSCLLIFSVFFLPKKGFSQEKNTEPGYLQLITNAPKSYIVVDRNLDQVYELSSLDSIKLAPGKHHFTIFVKNASDFETELTIEPGITKKYHLNITSFYNANNSSYELLRIGNNFTFNTDPNSVIYINGKEVGMGSYSGFLLSGKNKIKAVHPELGELKKTIKINSYKGNYLARFNERPKLLSTPYKWLPSVAYFATGEKLKGGLTLASLGAVFTGIILERNSFNDNKLLFDEATYNYENATNILEVRLYRKEVVKYQDAMNDNNKNITMFAIAGAVVYGISTLDGIRKPKQGYKISDTFNIQPTYTQLHSNGLTHHGIGLKISLNR